MPTLSLPWSRKKVLGIAVLAVILTSVVALKMFTRQQTQMVGDIPLPFGSQNDLLQGSLTRFGQRNGIDVFEVSFHNDEKSEHLGPDKIYLVHVPNGSSVSDAPLDLALTLSGTGGHLVDYYGYRYSDAAATSEKRDIYALRFKDRFPGQFFMSETARQHDPAHGRMLAAFETANQITFRRTDNVVGGVRIDPAGGLYVFIVNASGGADLAVRDVTGCGNGIQENPEQCDDGNVTESDSCRNTCMIGLPIPLDQNSSGTGVSLGITQVAGTPMASNPSPIIPLVRFIATAKDSTLLQRLSFRAETGTLASLDHYRVWQDTNKDGVTDIPVSPSVSPIDGRITFDTALNWTGALVLSQSGTIFELKGDVLPGPKFSLRVGFASDDESFIGAKRSSGSFLLSGIKKNGVCTAAPCQISVQTNTATLWTLGDDLFGFNLFVTSKVLAETDTVVQNQKDVVLQRFEMRSQGDLKLTRLVFDAQQGSLADATKYALWVDTDDNGIVDTMLQGNLSIDSAVTYDGNTVIFQNFSGQGLSIPNDKGIVFEVHADIAPSAAPGSPKLQLQFSTVHPDYLSANRSSDGKHLTGIRTNGVCASDCKITVVTIPSTVYSLRPQGDLFIAKSSTPLRSRQLLGGTLGDEILRLQFHAEYESISPIAIRFSASGSGVGSIESLEVYRVGYSEPSAIATQGKCGDYPAQFCTGSEKSFSVPKGGNLDILVRPRMKTDTDGAVSGGEVTVSLEAPDSVVAVGDVSENSLIFNDSNASGEGKIFIGSSVPAPHHSIVGNKNVVVLSKITSITNADPNQNGTAVPTGTQRQIGQFKFTTAAANNVKDGANKWALTDVIFDLHATNVDLDGSSFAFSNKQDPTVSSPCHILDTTESSSLLISCWGINESSVQAEIDPASDATFVLSATVQNSKVVSSQTSSLQVSITSFTNALVNGMASGLNHLHWSDRDNAPDAGGFFWVEYPDTTINGTVYNQ